MKRIHHISGREEDGEGTQPDKASAKTKKLRPQKENSPARIIRAESRNNSRGADLPQQVGGGGGGAPQKSTCYVGSSTGEGDIIDLSEEGEVFRHRSEVDRLQARAVDIRSSSGGGSVDKHYIEEQGGHDDDGDYEVVDKNSVTATGVKDIISSVAEDDCYSSVATASFGSGNINTVKTDGAKKAPLRFGIRARSQSSQSSSSETASPKRKIQNTGQGFIDKETVGLDKEIRAATIKSGAIDKDHLSSESDKNNNSKGDYPDICCDSGSDVDMESGSRLRRGRPVHREQLNAPKIELSAEQKDRIINQQTSGSDLVAMRRTRFQNKLEKSVDSAKDVGGERNEKDNSPFEKNSRRRSVDGDVLKMRRARIQNKLDSVDSGDKSISGMNRSPIGTRGSIKEKMASLQEKFQADDNKDPQKVERRRSSVGKTQMEEHVRQNLDVKARIQRFRDAQVVNVQEKNQRNVEPRRRPTRAVKEKENEPVKVDADSKSPHRIAYERKYGSPTEKALPVIQSSDKDMKVNRERQTAPHSQLSSANTIAEDKIKAREESRHKSTSNQPRTRASRQKSSETRSEQIPLEDSSTSSSNSLKTAVTGGSIDSAGASEVQQQQQQQQQLKSNENVNEDDNDNDHEHCVSVKAAKKLFMQKSIEKQEEEMDVTEERRERKREDIKSRNRSDELKENTQEFSPSSKPLSRSVTVRSARSRMESPKEVETVKSEESPFVRSPLRMTLDSSRSLAERRRRLEEQMQKADSRTPKDDSSSPVASPRGPSSSGGLSVIRERYLANLKKDAEVRTVPKRAFTRSARRRSGSDGAEDENKDTEFRDYEKEKMDKMKNQLNKMLEKKNSSESNTERKKSEEEVDAPVTSKLEGNRQIKGPPKPRRLNIEKNMDPLYRGASSKGKNGNKVEADVKSRVINTDIVTEEIEKDEGIKEDIKVLKSTCEVNGGENGKVESGESGKSMSRNGDRRQKETDNLGTITGEAGREEGGEGKGSSSLSKSSKNTALLVEEREDFNGLKDTVKESSSQESSADIQNEKVSERRRDVVRKESSSEDRLMDVKEEGESERRMDTKKESSSGEQAMDDIDEVFGKDTAKESSFGERSVDVSVKRNSEEGMDTSPKESSSPNRLTLEEEGEGAGSMDISTERSPREKFIRRRRTGLTDSVRKKIEELETSPRVEKRRSTSLRERSSAQAEDGNYTGPGRHHTQPITVSEKEDTEQQVIGGTGSIKDRLSALQTSGEEGWKKRIGKDVDTEALEQLVGEVKLRDKSKLRGGDGQGGQRPVSLAERLSYLDEAQESWKGRVEEKDVKQFTIDDKMMKKGVTPSALGSPLTNRRRRVPKMPLNRGSESSDPPSAPSSAPNSMPSSPIKALPRPITLPPTVQVEDSTDVHAQSSPNLPTAGLSLSASDTDPERTNRVAVPSIDDDETFGQFFDIKEPEQLKKVDVTVDDFDHVFLAGADILPAPRKLRPQRKTIGSRNPVKMLMTREDIQTEYTEIQNDVAERELKRIKQEQITGTTVFAQEALAGLAAKVSFDKVKLNKADSFKAATPGGEKLLPYQDLMLIQIKGRRHCQVRLVEPVAASLNGGDCFLLVTRRAVWVWCGEYCNVIEKAKAVELGAHIQQKRDLGCQSSVEAMLVQESKQDGPNGKKFWAAMGKVDSYQDPGPAEEDQLYEMYMAETSMVYQLIDDSLVPVEEYWGQILKHELLATDKAFVFDFGPELYVWTGKLVPFNQRKIAIKLARELWGRGYDYTDCDINPMCPLKTPDKGGLPLVSETRPDWCLFGKVNENMETILFKEKFIDWPDASRLIKVKDNDDDKKNEACLDLLPYPAARMMPIDKSPVTLSLEGSHVGRGRSWVTNKDGLRREFEIMTLSVAMWHVLEYEHFKIAPISHGQFHEGDTYVIRWQYMIALTGMKDLKGQASNRSSMAGREKTAYFFWQGRMSSINEKGASALMTVELDDERGPQVRVVQGKEPPCFLSLFNGVMTTHIGKREDETTTTKGKYRLYIIRNELEYETSLLEVSCEMASLRSRGSFLLMNVERGTAYVWHGAKVVPHLRKRAKEIVSELQSRCPPEMGLTTKKSTLGGVIEVEEGAEKVEFWEAIGGSSKKRSLYHSLMKAKSPVENTPRLFYMNSVSGEFEAREILNPSRNALNIPCAFSVLQSELYQASQPALFLVDNATEVFLWQGWWPQEEEGKENVKTGSAQARFNIDRKCALQTTLDYCKAKNSSRPPPAYVVFGGLEPLMFTNLFPMWEEKEEIAQVQQLDGRYPNELVPAEELLQKLSKTRYTWEELQERPLPEGVDPLRIEAYLAEEDFQDVLSMTKEEFYALPSWKQGNLKKDAGLF